MRSIRISTIALFLALASFSAFGQSRQERSEIENAVLAVMTVQSEAWNRGNLDGFMEGYWKSDTLVFASGDRVTRGWQATLDNYKKTYGTKEKMGELAFADLEVNVLSREIAVVVGSWSLKRATDNPKGKFTLIFQRRKEGWRIIHDHTS